MTSSAVEGTPRNVIGGCPLPCMRSCSAGPSLASKCRQRAKPPIEGVQRLCGGRAARHMVLGMPLLTVHFVACSSDMLPREQPADNAESCHWAAGSPQDRRRHARGRDHGRSLTHTCQRAVMSVSGLSNTSLCLDVLECQLQVHLLQLVVSALPQPAFMKRRRVAYWSTYMCSSVLSPPESAGLQCAAACGLGCRCALLYVSSALLSAIFTC